MSLLLKDRIYTMESPTAKRGTYPLHGYKLGLFRLPITLEDPADMKSIHDGLKKTFEMEMFAQKGLWSGRFLFLRKVLSWTSLEYSRYTTILGVIGLLAQYVAVPVLANKVKLHDSTISLLGIP